jgi:hypothetical protein
MGRLPHGMKPDGYYDHTQDPQYQALKKQWNDRREEITPRMAQGAAMHLGSDADAILGPGGLSGATMEQHRRLVAEARRQGWDG